MSMEASGGLIQMTAHMVVKPWAHGMIVAGIAVAAVFAFLAICAPMSRKKEHKRRYVLAFAVFALLGVALTIVGARQPRRKILYCCANGPVDLQMVVTRYDLLEVDGKLLKLAER